MRSDALATDTAPPGIKFKSRFFKHSSRSSHEPIHAIRFASRHAPQDASAHQAADPDSEILSYDDPRPRTVETLSEANFIATKKRSLEIFQREVRR